MLITDQSQSGLIPISIDEVLAARARIDWIAALRTPLIRFQDNDESDIYVKLENLQPMTIPQALRDLNHRQGYYGPLHVRGAPYSERR